jgi:C4-dicarboxylate transporter DctQ subunit
MLDRILTIAENTIITIVFSAITVLAFVNVISRYVLHASIAFTSELVINLAVLLTMVGAAAAVRLGTHPGFTLLRDSSRGVLHKTVVVLIAAAMLAFYLLFLWLGWEMASDQLASARQTFALGIPQWVLSMALPVGAALGAIRTVQVTVLELRGKLADAPLAEKGV